MIDYKYIALILIVVVIGVVVFINLYKKRENYADVFTNADQFKNMVGTSNFSSNLQPVAGQDPTSQSYLYMRSSDPYASAGIVNAGMSKSNDSSYLAFSQGDSPVLTLNSSSEKMFSSSNDYSKLVDTTKQEKQKKYNVNNTLEYTTPQDLLPTPDMSQPLVKDPSDPSNFMYDRTLFAPLKSRNKNVGDRIRGDLDIEPIKTGWFDIATNPKTDLVKGYLGSFRDIQEHQELQDVIYERDRLGDKQDSRLMDPRFATAPRSTSTSNNPWGRGINNP